RNGVPTAHQEPAISRASRDSMRALAGREDVVKWGEPNDSTGACQAQAHLFVLTAPAAVTGHDSDETESEEEDDAAWDVPVEMTPLGEAPGGETRSKAAEIDKMTPEANDAATAQQVTRIAFKDMVDWRRPPDDLSAEDLQAHWCPSESWPSGQARIGGETAAPMGTTELRGLYDLRHPQAWRRAQAQDPLCKRLLTRLEVARGMNGRANERGGGALQPGEVALLSQCYMERGVLKRKQWRGDRNSPNDQYIVPKALRDVVLLAMHEDATAGHQGTNRTLARVLESFWWPTVTADTAWWCRACLKCQARKSRLMRKLPLCVPTRPSEPGEMLGIDILGPLPQSEEGYLYLLVMVDLFTRWVELAPLTAVTNTAVGVAEQLVDLILCRGVAPRKIVSDRGKHFTAKVSQALYDYMRTKKATTTAYRPQSDGQAERVMPQVAAYLSMYVSDYQADWPKYLHLMRLALNTAVCRVTGVSPHELATGRKPRLPWAAMALESADYGRRKEL
ncbi:unnamed protein product, partial [Phaeothamnion confervicola]